MIRPMIGTIGTRVIVTLLNLFLVMATGKLLGIEGLGAVSLIVLGITFILLLSNVIGGGALVYLAPRYRAEHLLVPAYAWVAGSAMFAYVLMELIPMVPYGLAMHIAALSFLHALVTIHLAMLLGRKKIGWQNGLQILQAALLLGFYWFLLHQRSREVMDYIFAAYAAHGITAIASGIMLLRTTGPIQSENTSAWAALFRQGGMVQGANLMQFINYRFTFLLIETLKGLGALGIFSVAVQLAESAWLAPKSLGTVLYSEISNTTDPDRQRDITLTILKAALVFSVVVIIGVLIVPGSVYQWLFGDQVTGLRPIILILAPGLIAMAASQAFSHYFSGTGKNQHNVAGSGIAMVLTLGAGYFLVERYGLWGAAATGSLAYSANGIYQGLVFSQITGARLMEYLPGAGDLKRLKSIWEELRS